MKKHKHTLRKSPTAIIFWILLIANITVAVPLFLSWCAGFIAPSISGLAVCCGLGFLYLLVANVVFVILWLPFRIHYCLISLTLIFLNVNTIDKYYQMNGSEVPDNCPHTVKVMSYNAHLFGLYNDDDMQARIRDKDKIFDFIRNVQPDILCIQEYFMDKSESLHFHTTDSLLAILKLEDIQNTHYLYFTDNNKHQYYYGLAIFSRFRIVDAGPILMDSSSNAAIYVDIKYRSDTFRIYNLHLTSLRMDAVDYSVGEQIVNNHFDDPKIDKNIKKLYQKIISSARRRQIQTQIIRQHMDDCPYAMIVCGDFNEPPAGYAYNVLSKKLKDTFRESGKGFSYTYHGINMPHYRIDYIFHDKKYNSFGHTVGDSVNVSDHYPIYATISLQKKS